MTRLLVLWLLNERSCHGYEIKKALSDTSMRFWFGIDDASIYSALRTLTKHGYARAVGIEQVGGRPPRTRYAITAAGRRHYRELLLDAVRLPGPTVAPIDVALAARGDLDPTEVSAGLSEREKALHRRRDEITAVAAGTPSAAIVDRNAALVEAELAWLRTLDHATIT